MKKLIALLLATLMCLSLAACGNDTANKEKEDANDEDSSNGSDKKKDAVTDLFNKAKGLFK